MLRELRFLLNSIEPSQNIGGTPTPLPTTRMQAFDVYADFMSSADGQCTQYNSNILGACHPTLQTKRALSIWPLSPKKEFPSRKRRPVAASNNESDMNFQPH